VSGAEFDTGYTTTVDLRPPSAGAGDADPFATLVARVDFSDKANGALLFSVFSDEVRLDDGEGMVRIPLTQDNLSPRACQILEEKYPCQTSLRVTVYLVDVPSSRQMMLYDGTHVDDFGGRDYEEAWFGFGFDGFPINDLLNSLSDEVNESFGEESFLPNNLGIASEAVIRRDAGGVCRCGTRERIHCEIGAPFFAPLEECSSCCYRSCSDRIDCFHRYSVDISFRTMGGGHEGDISSRSTILWLVKNGLAIV
jgi:hypothetical protein